MFDRSSARFRRLPLRDKISLMFIPVVALPLLLLATVTGGIATSLTVRKARQNSQDQLLLISRQVKLIADDIEHNVIFFSISKHLQDSLAEKREPGIIGDLRYRSAIAPTFNTILNIGAYVARSRIVDSQGRIYDTLDDSVTLQSPLVETSEYRALEGSLGRLVWRDLREGGAGGPTDPMAEGERSVLQLSKIVIDLSSGRYIGVISINIREEPVSAAFSGIRNGKSGEIFIVNGDGIIVASQRKDRLFSSVADEPYFGDIGPHGYSSYLRRVGGRDTFVTSAPVLQDLGLHWYLVSAVPVEELTAENGTIILAIVAAGALCLILTLLISRRLADGVTRPVRQLVRFTKTISEGNFDAELRLEGEDEIAILARHFNGMVKSVRDLIVKNYVEQRKKREYELSLLQSQVNPHFLYNAIENIRSLTNAGDASGAYEVATSLGAFYKGVLSTGRDVITVAEELELNRNYLNIQQVRHEDLFEYVIDVDEAIAASAIQKLTLQPIVENSIQHGLRGFRDGGTIRIEGRLEGDLVRLTVSDDGKGIDDGTLATLRTIGGDILAASGPGGGNFGLRNIDERIKLHFGPEYGVDVQSTYGVGTRVTVILPFSVTGG